MIYRIVNDIEIDIPMIITIIINVVIITPLFFCTSFAAGRFRTGMSRMSNSRNHTKSHKTCKMECSYVLWSY